METAFVTIPLAEYQQLITAVQEISKLRAELESTQERFAREIALDRQRISKLEYKEPQPMQKDRAEILRALLVVNGGKILAKEARKRMHLSKERFSNLLSVCDFIQTKPYHLDRRQLIIILKSELVLPNY